MDSYTVLLFVKNEEKRIEFVLRNFRGRARVLVLDGGSTDRTAAIAASHGCEVVQRPELDSPGQSVSLKKWALEQSPTDYVFIAYASMVVPPKLLDIFGEVSRHSRYKAVFHDSQAITYGRFVQKPAFRRRSSSCHFFARDAINFETSRIHFDWPVDCPESQILTLPAKDALSVFIIRDYDVKWMEQKCSIYADIDALQRFEAGERTSLAKMCWMALRHFLYGYFRCGGFRGGVPGLLYQMGWAQMVFNIQGRIWEMQNEMTREKSTLLHVRMRDEMLREIEAAAVHK